MARVAADGSVKGMVRGGVVLRSRSGMGRCLVGESTGPGSGLVWLMTCCGAVPWWPGRLPLAPSGGAPCAVRAPCEKLAILDRFPSMAKVTAVTTVFPYTGLLRFLLSPKTQIKLCFTLKVPDCCPNLLFLSCGCLLPRRWVVCRVVTGAVRMMYSVGHARQHVAS